MAPEQERAPGRIAGFDGIRAVAIATVIALHTGLRIAKGGTVGVDLFFVLSGFLITGLIVAEFEKTERFRFRAFYARRFARLMPALIVMVVVTVLLCQFLSEVTLPRGHTAVGGLLAVTYTSDIAIAFFNANVGPLFHTWTLGLEEYYYLCWPPLLILMLRRGWSRLKIVQVTAVPVGAIALWRIVSWLAWHNQAHSRYGFDVRSDQLLIGSILAIAAPYAYQLLRVRGWQALLGRCAWLSAIFIGLVVVADPPLTFLVVIGYWLNAAAAGILILCVAASPASSVSRILSLPPVAYIGRISYSLYLWGAPLDDAFPNRIATLPHSVTVVAQYGTILVVAILSHHLVELPVQRLVRRRQRSPRLVPPVVTAEGTSEPGPSATIVTGVRPTADASQSSS